MNGMTSIRDRYEHRPSRYQHLSYGYWKGLMLKQGVLRRIKIDEVCNRYKLPTNGTTAAILWDLTSSVGPKKAVGPVVGFHHGDINKVTYILAELEDKGFVLVR